MNTKQIITVGAASVIACVITTAAQSQVRVNGPVTTLTLPSQSQAGGGIDFANATPMPLPVTRTRPPSASEAIRSAVDPLQLFGLPGVSPGGPGSGEKNPAILVEPKNIQQGAAVEPQEFGTSEQPYTTSRVYAYADLTVNNYPFRAAGKLFFKIGPIPKVCSASLIGPGIVVTAAHCVANYGQKQFYSDWTYVPAYNNGSAPYGTWTAQSASILTAYYDGTDNCADFGIVCPDDVAVMTQQPQSGKYPGSHTGFFGYGFNGFGYNGSSQALINQLGYPVDLDDGEIMERTDSQGFVSIPRSNNTIIGSLQTGGSSGGPWLVNLGAPPSLSGGISFGTAADHNVVVNVTSWGFTDPDVKQQGASPFTSGNIVTLVNHVCTATPAAC